MTATVAAAVVVTTDEATSTAAMRVARMAALAPLVAALATLSVVAHARSRGELRAVECLGVPPWRAARGAAVAAAVVAALGMIALLTRWADATSLFPAVRSAVDWSIDANGRLASALGVVVSADGTIALTALAPHPARGSPAGWASLPTLAPLALFVPSWAVTPMSLAARGGSIAAAAGLAVVCLHLIAAGRVPPAWGAVTFAPLLAATTIARRSP